METTRVQTGTVERIEVLLLDASNDPVTSASVTLKIRRKSDGKFWNGTNFQVNGVALNMIEVDSVNEPGKYYYSFDTSTLDADEYYFRADSEDGTNVPQIGEMKVGGFVDYLDKAISEIKSSSGGGGYFAGVNAATLYWTEEEKLELLDKVRSILRISNSLEFNQAEVLKIAEIIKAVIDTMSLNIISAKKLIENITIVLNSLLDIIKNANLIEQDGIAAVQVQLDTVKNKIDTMTQVQTVLEDIHKVLTNVNDDKQKSLTNIEETLKDNCSILEDLLKLSTKTASVEALESLVKETNNEV